MKQDISNIGEIVMYQPPTLSVKSVVREFQPTALVELQSNAETIVGKLSFSHLCELVFPPTFYNCQISQFWNNLSKITI